MLSLPNLNLFRRSLHASTLHYADLGIAIYATDPFNLIVRALSELLNQVKDEQSYIVVRERTHRNTAESTNARVKWWSIFQLGVLLGEGVFQVWWLKRFFEVKRTV